MQGGQGVVETVLVQASLEEGGAPSSEPLYASRPAASAEGASNILPLDSSDKAGGVKLIK